VPARIPNYRPSSLPTAAPQSRRDDVKFYQSARWRALRVLVLREEPICTCGLPAKHVHHIKPRKERPDLQWERSNLEALCIPCHNAKDTR
jgi:5-methylcytosine-specific restriction endonuclease McrA